MTDGVQSAPGEEQAGARGRAVQIVMMGVSGTGKSTVGRPIADMVGGDLLEGDDYHPKANVEKMSSGVPLTDEDRWPWLRAMAEELEAHRAAGRIAVLACSALRRPYRDILRGDAPPDATLFVHLYGDFDLLRERMSSREHFMPASLLQSQFDTLEELEPDESGIRLDVADPVDSLVEQIREYLVEQGVLPTA